MEMQRYFQSYKDYFWQWEDGEEVIAIPGGNTIAYKAFITEVLDKLNDQGLPFFGSLLLTLLATNAEGEQNLALVEKILLPHLPVSNGEPDPLKPAIAFLNMLATLPVKYKRGPNRLLLLQTLFADCHNHLSAANSKAIVSDYRTTYVVGKKQPAVETFSFHLYHKEFTVVKLLAKHFPTSEAIIEKMASLFQLEEPIQLEENQKEEKSFVETLLENNKTFHVGSLIKRLWSGLNIPHHYALPSEQPLGGVSDLTTKGEIHRLLLSEFANDDVLLLSRLANNEALYINREAPPQNNNRERILLLDVSIKNWGTPKILAFALLLAIAKHPKTNIACSAFVVGDRCLPISFSTIDDIIESLQQVEPSLHPVNGLMEFLTQQKVDRENELFFISSRETFRHPAVQHFFSEQTKLFTYWLLTDADGNIDLYKRQHNSRKHVQHLQLPLQDLWKREREAEPETSEIKGMAYPILFPGAASPKKVLTTSIGELFLITSEKALLRAYNYKDRSKQGWEMIADSLPMSGGEAEIGRTQNGEHLLLLFNVGNKQLTLMNLTTGQTRQTFFPEWTGSHRKQFFFYQDEFYCRVKPSSLRCWIITFDANIEIKIFADVPKEVNDYFLHAENKAEKIAKEIYQKRDVLKNVTSVFISQVGNLVFNCHELRLTDRETIRLEKTSFNKNAVSAQKSDQVFLFPDGSMVTINRSGMLILKSSNASLETIYVPSVLETTLGIATSKHFAGETYYYRPGTSGKVVPPKTFWKEYMNPFVEIITGYGA